MNKPWQQTFCVQALLLLTMVLHSWGLQIPKNYFSELGSPEFRNREIAQNEILEWARKRPRDAMNELLKQSRKATDPEVRERCLLVLKELVNDEFVKEGEGFLGISMLNEVTQLKDGPRIHHAIRVSLIMKGSAAEKAGLKLNDLIVGLDGENWTAGPAADPFSLEIKSKKPGTKVVLGLIREKEPRELTVVLGKRPLDANFLMMGDFSLDLNAAEIEAREAYFREWLAKRRELD